MSGDTPPATAISAALDFPPDPEAELELEDEEFQRSFQEIEARFAKEKSSMLDDNLQFLERLEAMGKQQEEAKNAQLDHVDRVEEQVMAILAAAQAAEAPGEDEGEGEDDEEGGAAEGGLEDDDDEDDDEDEDGEGEDSDPEAALQGMRDRLQGLKDSLALLESMKAEMGQVEVEPDVEEEQPPPIPPPSEGERDEDCEAVAARLSQQAGHLQGLHDRLSGMTEALRGFRMSATESGDPEASAQLVALTQAVATLENLEAETTRLNTENSTLQASLTELQTLAAQDEGGLARLQHVGAALDTAEWDAFIHRMGQTRLRKQLVVVDNLFADTPGELDIPALQRALGMSSTGGSVGAPECTLLYSMGVHGGVHEAAREAGWLRRTRNNTTVDTDCVADLLEIFIHHAGQVHIHMVGCDYAPYVPLLRKAVRYNVEDLTVYAVRTGVANPCHATLAATGFPVTLIDDIYKS